MLCKNMNLYAYDVFKMKKGIDIMEYKHESGLVATYDFGTVKDAIMNDADPIYIYKDIGFTENNITMSIEEAKWLCVKLSSLILVFEEEITKKKMNELK